LGYFEGGENAISDSARTLTIETVIMRFIYALLAIAILYLLVMPEFLSMELVLAVVVFGILFVLVIPELLS
jgi:hypothetical protein